MKNVLKKQNDFFNTNQTKTYEFRVTQLRKLKQSIKLNEAIIIEALFKDLHKSPIEAYTTEVGYVLNSINLMIKDLRRLIKPQRSKHPFLCLDQNHTLKKSHLVQF